MGKRKEKVYVIGHKNPDTDSICSAIAYADLRQKVTGQVHEAKRAGHVNDETAYVLDRFGVEAPKLLTDVRLQVRDLDIHEMPGLKPNASIRDTWERMQNLIWMCMIVRYYQKREPNIGILSRHWTVQ